MFEATRWAFASGDGEVPVVLRSPSNAQYTVLQRFDFDHTRMTQSVVVRAPGGDQDIFVKGSFEKIGAMCRPASLPADYAATAQAHAMNGCYVLALAGRKLGVAQVRGWGLRRGVRVLLSFPHRQELGRDQANRAQTTDGIVSRSHFAARTQPSAFPAPCGACGSFCAPGIQVCAVQSRGTAA